MCAVSPARGAARASTTSSNGCASTAFSDQPIETLSKGFKRRVGLAQAILHDPAVLIMDEPTDGLDPNQKHAVRTLINAMARDKTIIVSTHLLEEVRSHLHAAPSSSRREKFLPTDAGRTARRARGITKPFR